MEILNYGFREDSVIREEEVGLSWFSLVRGLVFFFIYIYLEMLVIGFLLVVLFLRFFLGG